MEVSEPKGRTTNQSLASKKRRDRGDKEQGRSTQDADSLSQYSSSVSENEKDKLELDLLRGQVEELHKQLLEKDELLNQMSSLHAKIDELRHESAEKDTFIKSIQLQLTDAKVGTFHTPKLLIQCLHLVLPEIACFKFQVFQHFVL